MKLVFLSNVPDTVRIKAIDKLYDNHLWSAGSREAYKFLIKAYDLAELAEYKKGQLVMLNNMAQFNFRKGNYELTLKQRLKGLELAQLYKDTGAISANYLAFGEVYKAEKNYEQALKYYLLSVNLEEKYIRIEKRLGTVYSLVGNMYNELNQDSLALDYQFKALHIREKYTDGLHIGASQGYIAKAYLKQKKYELAEEYGRKSLHNRVVANDNGGITFACNILGEIKIFKKQYDSAEYYFKKGLTFAKIQDSKVNLKDSYEKLSFLFEKKGDIKNALAYHKLFSMMNDSLLNSENIRNMAQMKELFESEQKDAEINLLNKQQIIDKSEIEQQNVKIQSRNTMVIASFISILLLAGLVFIVLKNNRERKKTNELLHSKNLLIEQKNKEIIDSINYAKRIQDSLFDNFEQVRKFFSDAMIIYRPKDIVSGDFYWISKKILTEKEQEGNDVVRELFFIAVCDSTGHGVPGGFMSLLNSAYLSEAVNEKNIYEPNKVFDYVRDRLIHSISKNDQKDGFDGILMCFEKKQFFKDRTLMATEHYLSYAAAYNAPVLVSGNQITVLEKNKMPVGSGERKEAFTLHTCTLKKGDKLYLYSDGMADQFGGPQARQNKDALGPGKKFQYKRLDDLILKTSDLKMEEQKEKIFSEFIAWKGDLEQTDDVLLVALCI